MFEILKLILGSGPNKGGINIPSPIIIAYIP